MSERDDSTFVYAIEIRSTPELVWQALTDNEFWQAYWDAEWRVESTWVTGAPLRYFTGDGTFFSEGEIVDADPPRSLTYTWPNPPEEQGDVPPELLTWKLEALEGGRVWLELTHSRITKGYEARVARGWISVVSSLKSVLEVGRGLGGVSVGGASTGGVSPLP